MEYRLDGKDFGAFLDRAVGNIGYLIGTRGQTCTQAMIDARLNSLSYKGYHEQIRRHAAKWIGEIVADCKGLYEMRMNGGDVGKPVTRFRYPDTNTGMMYKLAKDWGLPNGPISTLPKNCPYPIAVGYTGHVGYYHKGIVYQSAGHATGVIKTALTSTVHNRTWMFWYMIPYMDYMGWMPGKDEDIMLKEGDAGRAVYDYQIACKAAGYNIGAFGDMLLRDSAGRKLPTGCDGDFGPTMTRVTKEIQAKHGLPVTGIVDAATYGKLATEVIGKKTDTTALENQIKTLQAQTAALTGEKVSLQNKINSALSALK